MMGLKQDALASEPGEEWTQKRVSILEQKEIVEQDILEQISRILKVPSESIKNFNEEAAINIISNTYNDHAASVQYNFNPVDRWVEALEENKKLYERLLQSEQEKVELLRQLLGQKS